MHVDYRAHEHSSSPFRPHHNKKNGIPPAAGSRFSDVFFFAADD
ncbi:hypothetical protein HMPREF7215_2229 [Pyramidobacter piscolens W5455]|uniref:Uncharacterized protein n=1 Tax=Pyramidobacter piscolens W5455 TaxID=352165 RepID=A0ABP2HTQ3_9BACT|nr:hypothetical protein HMPREF7215_2229 [Pyramidobacter piscolens W5455]